MTETIETGAAARSPAERAEDIFRRYPDISAEEVQEALTFLKEGRHLDIGLVAGNPDISEQLAAFRHEYRQALRLGVGEAMIFALLISGLLGVLLWLLAR